MFASMLMFCEMTNPRQLWDAHREFLSDDIASAMTHRECDDLAVTLSEDVLKDHALYEIDQVLIRNGHYLENFPTLPKFNYVPFVHGGNRLVQEELAYDQHSLTTDADNVEDKLNNDQHNAYETILNVVTNKRGQTVLCVWQWWNPQNICLDNASILSMKARQNRAYSCFIKNCIFVVSGQ
jgi:hypothetical protein